MLECPKCNKCFDDTWKICLHCGVKLNSMQPNMEKESNPMKKCPFCAEDILENAKKCKHCNEWLDNTGKDTNRKLINDPTNAARAVAKGIKEKELADFQVGAVGLISLFLAIVIGIATKSFWIGFIIFIVPMFFLAKSYYKE